MLLGSGDALIAGEKHVGRIKAYVRDANGRRFVGSVRPSISNCRLARRIYSACLMGNRVPFIVSELGPDVDPFMLHVYAALSEKERKLISDRTRDALKAAKARGRVLRKHGREVLGPNRAAALERAKRLEETVRSLPAEGKGVREIAVTLNERRFSTPLGGKWHPTSVHRLLSRLKE
jgi:DNA invertase Pin-like site-specific DNA recombinase